MRFSATTSAGCRADGDRHLGAPGGEREGRAFNERIEGDATSLLSAASYLEAAIIIDDRLGSEGGCDLKLFLVEADIEVMPVTMEQAEGGRLLDILGQREEEARATMCV